MYTFGSAPPSPPSLPPPFAEDQVSSSGTSCCCDPAVCTKGGGWGGGGGVFMTGATALSAVEPRVAELFELPVYQGSSSAPKEKKQKKQA